MARYTQDDSIGDMLMRGGMLFGQMRRQEEERKLHNLGQALNMISTLSKLPPNLRSNQEVLKGLDETMQQLSGGKIKLPKADEQTIASMLQGKMGGAVEGGMTPVGQLKDTPQVGQYLPIKEPETQIYGFDKKKGGVVPLGKVPEGAKVMDYGETEKPDIPFFDSSGRPIGSGKTRPFIMPETPEQKWQTDKRKIDYQHELKKEFEKYQEGKPVKPTGMTGTLISYLEAIGEKPQGPDGKWAPEQFDNAIGKLHAQDDPGAVINNKQVLEAIKAATKNLEYSTASPEEKRAMINQELEVFRGEGLFQTPQKKYGTGGKQVGGKGKTEKQYLRFGTKDGRRVGQLPDGTIEYVD